MKLVSDARGQNVPRGVQCSAGGGTWVHFLVCLTNVGTGVLYTGNTSSGVYFGLTSEIYFGLTGYLVCLGYARAQTATLVQYGSAYWACYTGSG